MYQRIGKTAKYLGLVTALSLGVGASTANATVIDLTTAGSTATITADLGGTLLVYQIDPQSTGTGVIDSFLRINSNDTSESGYNTDVTGVLDNVAGNFTHSLLLTDVPIVTVNGVEYREFRLDVNQTNADPLLSLNQLQFFTASSDPGANYTETTVNGMPVLSLTGATEVFRMSSQDPLAADFYDLHLNYALNAGSGSGDYRFLVASSLFGSATNVILYSQFGTPPGVNNENDGFEEWFVFESVTPGPGSVDVVPEPGTLLLLGGGLGFVARRFRRKVAA